MYEGSTLKFDVPAIFKDLEYDLVVRYEHQPNHPNQWEQATAELIPIDGPPDPDGKCNTTDDSKRSFKMSPDQRHTLVQGPLCLEEGKRYEILLSFDQYDDANPDRKASILIDSVSFL